MRRLATKNAPVLRDGAVPWINNKNSSVQGAHREPAENAGVSEERTRGDCEHAAACAGDSVVYCASVGLALAFGPVSFTPHFFETSPPASGWKRE